MTTDWDERLPLRAEPRCPASVEGSPPVIVIKVWASRPAEEPVDLTLVPDERATRTCASRESERSSRWFCRSARIGAIRGRRPADRGDKWTERQKARS